MMRYFKDVPRTKNEGAISTHFEVKANFKKHENSSQGQMSLKSIYF